MGTPTERLQNPFAGSQDSVMPVNPGFLFWFDLSKPPVVPESAACSPDSQKTRLPDDSLEPVLEPLDGVGLGDLVGVADLGLRAPALGDTLTGAGPVELCQPFFLKSPQSLARASWVYAHADVEVHSVDTDRRVVLDAQVDVLGDTETEVAGLGEVALPQLVLLDLEATLENLLSLGATDGDVDGDLFVAADTEGTDGVAGLACRFSISGCAVDGGSDGGFVL